MESAPTLIIMTLLKFCHIGRYSFTWHHVFILFHNGSLMNFLEAYESIGCIGESSMPSMLRRSVMWFTFTILLSTAHASLIYYVQSFAIITSLL